VASDRGSPARIRSPLEEQNRAREPDLVPVRHGRMMVSPFTFCRGAAKVMAVDLADMPVAGLEAQLCGDAHLSNFGVFTAIYSHARYPLTLRLTAPHPAQPADLGSGLQAARRQPRRATTTALN
jgi:hypothetical protein